MVYIWVEDSTSGFVFWTDLCKILYGDSVTVETKFCAGDLVNDVVKLCKQNNKNNSYIILFDNAYDNPSSVSQMVKLKSLTRGLDNIILVEGYISLEMNLLSFSDLIFYLGNQKDLSSLKIDVNARDKLLRCVDFSCGNDYSITEEIIAYCEKYKVKKKYTIESLASSILKRLTKNTDFNVTKGNIGTCWLSACCDSPNIYPNCVFKISQADKVKSLVDKSFLVEVVDIINKVVA